MKKAVMFLTVKNGLYNLSFNYYFIVLVSEKYKWVNNSPVLDHSHKKSPKTSRLSLKGQRYQTFCFEKQLLNIMRLQSQRRTFSRITMVVVLRLTSSLQPSMVQ